MSIRLVRLVGSIPAQGRGLRRRRDRLVSLVLVDEEGVEAAAGGGRCHRPDDNLDCQRHDFSDFIAEHDGEEAGERPDRCLDRLPARRMIVQIFIKSQTCDKGNQVQVREHNEDYGARVAVGAVDGHAGVESEEAETENRETRQVCHCWKWWW